MNIQIYIYVITAISTFVAAILFATINYRKSYNEEFRKQIGVDIDLNEMRRIEDLVSSTKKEYNLDDNTELYSFAEAIHVKEGKVLEDLNTRARINPKTSDGFMHVDFSANLSPVDHRFALAHECGHVLNKHPIPNTQQSGHGKPEIEQIADYTAAAILMPRNKVIKFLNDVHYNDMDLKQKKRTISQMCKMFEVSEISAIKRIKEVKSLCSEV